MSRHQKRPTTTVLIVVSIDGNDYFRETPRGYSEDQAFADILAGQIEDVQQVLLSTGEDITARMANRICRAIEWDAEPNESASRFAEDFSAYERPRPALTWLDKIDAEHARFN